MSEENVRKTEYPDAIGWGFLLAILIPIVVGFLASNIGVPAVAGVVVFGVGLVQWLYIVPLSRYLKTAGYSRNSKGLLIGASVITLLNASCWGAVFFISGKMR